MRRLLAVAVLLLAPSLSRGQVINAASCSQTDVQSAFSAVVSSTVTVNIPLGVCHWTAKVNLNVPSGSTNLSVLGAGNLSVTGGGDTTVIIDDDTTDHDKLLNIITNNTASSRFRLAGLTIQGGLGANKQNGLLAMQGQSQNVRVDHNHFNNTTYTVQTSGKIRFTQWLYGVFDHNIVDSRNGTTVGLDFWEDQFGSPSLSDGDALINWATASNLGSGQAMFVEDNVFNNPWVSGSATGSTNDCSHGGRYVVRHNTITREGTSDHPTGGAGSARGCRTQEIYQNTFLGDSHPNNTVVWFTSGTALAWGNTGAGGGSITGYNNLVTLHSERVSNATYTQQPTPNGWGYCGTSSGLAGSGSLWDQTQGVTGYACLDQPGQGVGDLLTGAFPSRVNSTTGTIAWPHQKLEPIYEWLNPWTNPGSGGYVNNAEPPQMQQNRDYYFWCNVASSSGCTSFNGTVGVGSGVLASRPATCTPLVAYWATDTNTLYQCAATNTWSTYYTPFTYPHPLVSATNAPSPPTNLTISTSGSNVTLNWLAPSGTSTGFNVYRGTVHGGPYTLVSAGVTVTTFADSSLANGTYFYVVTAFNGGVVSNITSNGTTATVTCSATCTFPSSSSANIAGNSVAAFNGTFTTIGQPTGSTFTFSSSTNSTGTGGGAWLSGNESVKSNEVTTTVPANKVVTLLPASLTYAAQTVGTSSATQSVTLTNTSAGGITVNLSSVSFTGTNPADFSQTNNCPAGLGSGASCTVTVTFTPIAAGARSASLSVADDASGSPQTTALSGTGVSQAPAVVLVPSSLTFGPQLLTTTSATQTTQLQNTGTGVLNITSISLTGANSGDFGSSTTCGSTLGAGLACNINVTFTPTATGTRVASVSVVDSAAGSPHTAALTGTGTTTKCALVGIWTLSGLTITCGP